ncbi:MAG: hypothetical protein LBP40_02840 [Campylobacteraceae bacterium]|nr:hypothetical protein [Campylobacteraceae bacterium]
MKIFDTTVIHAKKAVEFVCGKKRLFDKHVYAAKPHSIMSRFCFSNICSIFLYI